MSLVPYVTAKLLSISRKGQPQSFFALAAFPLLLRKLSSCRASQALSLRRERARPARGCKHHRDHDACTACQQVKQAPTAAPLHPWIWPSRPWQRVHVDFAEPFLGSMYLIAVDAHSKWPEAGDEEHYGCQEH